MLDQWFMSGAIEGVVSTSLLDKNAIYYQNKGFEHKDIPKFRFVSAISRSWSCDTKGVANDKVTTTISRSRSVDLSSSVFSSAVFSPNGKTMPFE